MSRRITFATSLRVLTQLRRDPRTIALLMLVPPMLQALLKGAFYAAPATYQRIGGPLLGMFPLSTMFVVTSVTTLRERTTGTLERLMSMPMGKLDLLFGYGIAFSLVAIVQASFTAAIVFGLLGLNVAGSTVLVVAIAVANALLGMGLGLFASSLAETEYQAVQFLPAIIIPQFLLCGLFVARDQMIGFLHALSAIMPLTYAYDALERITTIGSLGVRGRVDVIVVAGVTLLLLVLGGMTIRRRTA